MKSTRIMFAICCFLIPAFVMGQDTGKQLEEEALAVVREIYSAISSEPGKTADWDAVRTLFVDEALIVLRTSPEGSTQFTLEEFIQDFKDFYASPAIGESGFKEEILHMKSHVYGDAAFVGVVYTASIPGSKRLPQKGVDFWLLTHKEDTWKIVAVTNDIIPPGQEIPENILHWK